MKVTYQIHVRGERIDFSDGKKILVLNPSTGSSFAEAHSAIIEENISSKRVSRKSVISEESSSMNSVEKIKVLLRVLSLTEGSR